MHIATGPALAASSLDDWNAIIGGAFENLTVDELSEGFGGAIELRQVGGLALSLISSSPAIVRRGAPGCGRTSRYFKLHIQDLGSSQNFQGGSEAVLAQGDMMLCDSARPYSIRFDDPNRMLVLRLPEDKVLARFDDPDALVGRRLGAESLGAAMLGAFARNLWQAPEAGDVGVDYVDVVLDLMAIAFEQGPRHEAPAGHKDRIRRFVDENLCDPELSVGAVACGVGVSPRYVQMAFASIGTTPMAYIRDKRLQLAAQRLRRDGADCCITTLAFDIGFNDLSHFSRAFKGRFGIGPREYRAARA